MALVSLLDAQPWYAIMARENRCSLDSSFDPVSQGCGPSSRQAPRQPAALTMCREMTSFSSVEASGTSLVFGFVGAPAFLSSMGVEGHAGIEPCALSFWDSQGFLLGMFSRSPKS